MKAMLHNFKRIAMAAGLYHEIRWNVGPITMQHTEVKVLLDRQMAHTRHKRLPQRSIIGPFGKDFVDGRIVDGRFALGIVWDRQALSLHARVEDP
jgi:hypothetical protein